MSAQAKPYLPIQDITTPNGLHVWFVQDKTVPVLSLKFSLQGGTQLDPAGKEGIGNLLTTLFDEGAGPYTSPQFQDQEDRYGIHMGFDIGHDAFYGTLKTTTQYQDKAIELFSAALNAPHFNADAVDRMKQAVLSEQRANMMNPGWMAQKILSEQVFAGSPYAHLDEGTAETVAAMTPDDIKKQRDLLFCRDHLHIAVTGDITPQQLGAMVDGFFPNWPTCSYTLKTTQIPLQQAGQTITIDYPGAQSIMIMAQPGLRRQDKDWWAARILDFALGGGEFSSRLMNEVRVKRGLTYGVSTSILPLDRAPLWLVEAGVDNTKRDLAAQLIKKTWADVARDGLTPDEIKEAKDHLIGTLPLALTSTDQITGILLQLQDDDLPMDTLDRRAEQINAVTPDDIKRIAHERLHEKQLTTIIVGPAKVKQDEQADPISGVAKTIPTRQDIR